VECRHYATQSSVRRVCVYISVENVAYGKSSWINNRRQYKRHVRSQWMRGHASRAVDGDDGGATIHSCTVLDNYYVDRPTWMVDLGQRTAVAGVKIITWQGKELGVVTSSSSFITPRQHIEYIIQDVTY